MVSYKRHFRYVTGGTDSFSGVLLKDILASRPAQALIPIPLDKPLGGSSGICISTHIAARRPF